MATGPKIVHKQFNSPIGLYSQRNIQDTLNKHMQNLDNGTVGIDFSDPNTDKPGNLAHSAVLRLLEEEEHGRRRPGQKKVVWPPVPETNGYHQPQHQQQSPAYNAQHSPSQNQQQYHSPQPQPQYQSPQQQYQEPQYQQSQPPSYQQNQPPSYQQNQPPSYQPAYCDGRRQEQTGLSKLIPVGPGVTAAPAPPYRQAPQSPLAAKQQPSRWAPVPAPLSPQAAYQQQPQYSPQQQQYSPQQYPQYPPQYSPQQYSAPEYAPPEYQPEYQPPQRQFEPPPTTITLRQQPPVHQKPPPVFASQPAAASFQGGVNMRGDQKWPPQNVREAVAAENEARVQLARGPACRPRKVKKDYSGFFAQHALNQTYPGYRAPPGTQHYEDHSGQSSY